MTSKIFYIIIIVLIFSNLFLSVKFQRINKLNSEVSNQAIREISTTNRLISKIIQSEILELDIIGRINSLIYVEDSTHEQFLLQDLFTDRPTLFFRFTESGCSSCIDQQFKALMTIKSIKIRCLVSCKNPGYFIHHHKYKGDNIDFFFLKENELTDLELETNTPFLFLTKDKKTFTVFVPVKEIPELTDRFYNWIKANEY